MAKNISKGVIFASGSGTRSRPITYYIPKPMLPLGNSPITKLIADQLIQSGIRDILLVSRNDPEGKGTFQQVADYFSIENSIINMPEYRKQIENGRIKFSIGFQGVDKKTHKPLGTAKALKVAYDKGFLNDEPAVVMLSDVIQQSVNGGNHLLLKDMLSNYNGDTLVSMTYADPKTISNKSAAYGAKISNKTYKLSRIIEKPTLEYLKDNMTNISVGGGIYLLNEDAQNKVGKIKRGFGGEYQITDLLDMQAKEGNVYGYMIDKSVFRHYDVGEFGLFIRQNMEEKYKQDFFNYIKNASAPVKTILIGGVGMYGTKNNLDSLLSQI
ncbi:MAG: Nucleotidyl transferase [Candidatus Parvarchaeum acidophilus ARMAN-5]|jgi:UTP--glucose-1-phosphate uridylyltransferase|uniref:UTP--glucose-1-phosphate uridylyltransferase n=1 Tax=Candidatus Parvarchaeum acidophilus ARMAN-5 TaxID=662762 RepID=D6GVR5_PARA5|nr:MAG: Nucleotidyl transferase [Candidatus Parvarchaeum acidophilus ARMAN-5]